MATAKKKAQPETVDSRVTAYIDGVTKGRIVACRWVKLAVKHHVKDLKAGKGRNLWFDAAAARLAVNFAECLPLSKGKSAGKPLRLEGWQLFIFWCVYGWKRPTASVASIPFSSPWVARTASRRCARRSR